MSKCCVECASLFKISKETGQIVWSKNLGFDVTAVARHSDRIYAAIRPVNHYDSFLFSYYDIIVLNLDGDVLEEECINIFPKNTKDVYNEDTKEFKKGISSPFFDSFTQLHVFDKYNELNDNYDLYIIGIYDGFIYQITNGKLTKIQNVISFDNFFENDLLYFVSGNAPSVRYQKLGESSNICRFKIEIGENYISYNKYDLLGYNYDNEDSNLPKVPSVPDIYVLNIGNEDESRDNNRYIHISDYEGLLYKYETKTDNRTYTKFIFDENEFPLISLFNLPETSNIYDETKTFDLDCGANNYYSEYAGFDDNGNMLYDYNILYKTGHPEVPDFYVSILDLVTFDYTYKNIKSNENRISIESVFKSKDIINDINVKIPRWVRNKFDVETVALEVVKIEGNEVIIDAPPVYYYTKDVPTYYNNLKVLDIQYGPDDYITKLKYNDNISIGWYDYPVNEIASTSITLDDPNFILNFFGSDIYFIDQGDFKYDYLYTLTQDVNINATGYLNNILKPTAETKLKNIRFHKNSKSYIKNGKIIFNASLYLDYQIYIDIYAVSAKPQKGNSIQFNWDWDGYIITEYGANGYSRLGRTTVWPGYTETFKGFAFAYLPGDTINGIDELEYYNKMFGGDAPWVLLDPNSDPYADGVAYINRDKSVIRTIVGIGSGITIVRYRFLPPILTDEHPLIHMYRYQQLDITFHVYGGKKSPYGGVFLRKDVLISLDIETGEYDIIYLNDNVNTTLNKLKWEDLFEIGATNVYGEYLFEQVVAPNPFTYDVDYEIYSEHEKISNKIKPPVILTPNSLTNPFYPIVYQDVEYQSVYEFWQDFDMITKKPYIKLLNDSFDDNRINSSLRYRLITKDNNNDNIYIFTRSDDGYRIFHKYINGNVVYEDIFNSRIPVPVDGIAYNYNHSTGDGLPSWSIVFSDIINNNVDNRLEELYERFPNLYEKYDIANKFITDIENELKSYYDKLSIITDDTDYQIAIQNYPLTFILDLYRKGFTFNEAFSKYTDYFVDIIDNLYPNSRNIKVKLKLEKSNLIYVNTNNEPLWEGVVKYLDLDINIDTTTAEDLIENQIKTIASSFIEDFDFKILSNGPLIERPILIELPKRIIDRVVSNGSISTYSGKMYSIQFLDVKEDLYEKERYNISCFTHNNENDKYRTKWDSNFLIPPRYYTDFTKEKELDSISKYNAHNMYYGYYSGEPEIPLDVTQDDDFLYLGTQKRKVFRRNYVNNSGDLLRDSSLMGVSCGELSNPFFRDYLE